MVGKYFHVLLYLSPTDFEMVLHKRSLCGKSVWSSFFLFFFFTASSLMESWDADKTARWMRKEGLSDKYVEVCQREHISGRALLLLCVQGPEKLKQSFQLKEGPLEILLASLKSHLETFDNSKPQVAIAPEEVMREWTVERLCSWFRCLTLPEVCIQKLEEEEINGRAFLLMRDSHKLQECLQLKAGSLLIIQHELALCEESWSGDRSNIFKEKPTLQIKASGREPSSLSPQVAPNQLNQKTEQVPYRELEGQNSITYEKHAKCGIRFVKRKGNPGASSKCPEVKN